MERDALLSPDEVYRYSLSRTWADGRHPHKGWVLWVMLNPSTADAEVDDATIRRCIGFSRSWGYGGLHVVNLYALRATDPVALRKHPDPIGPFNNDTITAFAMKPEVDLVIGAWGSHPMARHRAEEVRYLIEIQEREVCHLGLTRGGFPKHPLYLRSETEPARW